eukprot:2185738-Heterocapsa_arctica.AAC.1
MQSAAAVKHSAPGRDGLPYSAWKHAGRFGTKTLYLILVLIMQGAFMPMAFKDYLSVFAPKDTDSAQDLYEG